MFYSHQKKIIDEDKKHTGLWLGTGSAKTRIALAMACGNTLVIAPKTQVEDGNWEREFKLLLKEGFVSKISDLRVISKETFRRDWEKLSGAMTVIVDEAHTCLGATPNIRYVKKHHSFLRLLFPTLKDIDRKDSILLRLLLCAVL